MKLEFSREILQKNARISNFMKFQWEPSHFVLTQRQADLTKLTVAFRSFVNAPKNEEDLMYITSLALVSHPRRSCAHDVSITE
jgi:hypothetical protein